MCVVFVLVYKRAPPLLMITTAKPKNLFARVFVTKEFYAGNVRNEPNIRYHIDYKTSGCQLIVGIPLSILLTKTKYIFCGRRNFPPPCIIYSFHFLSICICDDVTDTEHRGEEEGEDPSVRGGKRAKGADNMNSELEVFFLERWSNYSLKN